MDNNNTQNQQPQIKQASGDDGLSVYENVNRIVHQAEADKPKTKRENISSGHRKITRVLLVTKMGISLIVISLPPILLGLLISLTGMLLFSVDRELFVYKLGLRVVIFVFDNEIFFGLAATVGITLLLISFIIGLTNKAVNDGRSE